jgi:hypothetical protein
VHYQGRYIRQRLLALSDIERSQTYEFASTPTLPVSGFKTTLGVLEIVDGDGAFVQWRADFDCEPERREELCSTLSLWFGQWLESLRKEMIRSGSPNLAMAEGQWRRFDAILGNLTARLPAADNFSGRETSSNCCIRGAHLA